MTDVGISYGKGGLAYIVLPILKQRKSFFQPLFTNILVDCLSIVLLEEKLNFKIVHLDQS